MIRCACSTSMRLLKNCAHQGGERRDLTECIHSSNFLQHHFARCLRVVWGRLRRYSTQLFSFFRTLISPSHGSKSDWERSPISDCITTQVPWSFSSRYLERPRERLYRSNGVTLRCAFRGFRGSGAVALTPKIKSDVALTPFSIGLGIITFVGPPMGKHHPLPFISLLSMVSDHFLGDVLRHGRVTQVERHVADEGVGAVGEVDGPERRCWICGAWQSLVFRGERYEAREGFDSVKGIIRPAVGKSEAHTPPKSPTRRLIQHFALTTRTLPRYYSRLPWQSLTMEHWWYPKELHRAT